MSGKVTIDIAQIRKRLFEKTDDCIKKKMILINCYDADISVIPDNVKYCVEEWSAFEAALKATTAAYLKYNPND